MGIFHRSPSAFEVKRMPVGLERSKDGERMKFWDFVWFAVGLLTAELITMAFMLARS